jgi:hypothetical protein
MIRRMGAARRPSDAAEQNEGRPQEILIAAGFCSAISEFFSKLFSP